MALRHLMPVTNRYVNTVT